MGKNYHLVFKEYGVILSLLILFLFILTININAEEGHKITILHTNDSHSSLRSLVYDPDFSTRSDNISGGILRLAGLIEQERKNRDEDLLLISAGDFYGGDPYAWLSLEEKTPELNLMQQIGYDVVTIGNHEYDFGPEVLASYLKTAGYPQQAKKLPIVAANTVIPEDYPLADRGIKDYIIRETDSGLRIGIFGLIGNEAASVAHETGNIDFSSPVKRARSVVTSLQEEKVDIIIAVSHSGLREDKKLAKKVEGIDVIVGGHSHHLLEKPLQENNTIIVQAGSSLKYLGILELIYYPENRVIEILNQQNNQPFLITLDETVPESPDITDDLNYYDRELDLLLSDLTKGKYESFSNSAFSLDFLVPASPELCETQFGNFLTDAMRLGVEDITGESVDFVFQANGLIRRGLKPEKGGVVSYYQLASAAGLGIGPDNKPGYPLVEVYLTGEEVKNILEISVLLSEMWGDIYFLQTSGLRYIYDKRRAVLFNIPIIDQPLPSGKAVLKVEKYIGSGIQSDRDRDYKILEDNNDKLYRVVSDYYIMQFLPRVGEVVSSLELTLKDKQGKPLSNPKEAIIKVDGKELKVWQALFHYSDIQEGELSSAYKKIGNRIVTVKRFSLIAKAELVVIVIIIFIIILFYYFFRWVYNKIGVKS